MNSMTTQPSSTGVFDRAADVLSFAIGTPYAFAAAALVVAVWAVLGPFASFSDTWQLIINTGTTIVTFLTVFLLGNASNRLTENQDRMLAGIYGEERQLDAEERLIEQLLERIDVEHIRPILRHLDEQDHQVEASVRKLLEAIQAGGAAPF